jgi:hypothetical protein
MEPAHTQATQATEATAAPQPGQSTAAPTATERLNYVYLAIIGVAMGLVAPFTAFAWPLAIGVGMTLGLAAVERSSGIQQRGSVHLLRALVLVVGTILMFFFGAIIGGVIALLIVGLASLAERVSANAGPTDRAIGRILIVIITAVVWFVILNVLKLNVNISIGG